MHPRRRHRVLRTIYLAAVMAIFVFVFVELLQRIEDQLTALLISFALGLLLLVFYELLLLRHLKEPALISNSIMQVYLGGIAIVAVLGALVFRQLFGVAPDQLLLILPLIIIFCVLVTHRPLDAILKKRLK
jgi:uncharacterized membrane protein YdcZ (DUF606 family)